MVVDYQKNKEIWVWSLNIIVFIHNQERIKSFIISCSQLYIANFLYASLSDILLITYWIRSLMLEMLFSDFFPSRWWPGGTLTDITLCKRHQGSTGKRNAAAIELVVDSSTKNSPSNINKISVFTDPKDCQVKHYYPKKKAVTLRINLAKKKLMAQRNQHLSFKYKYKEFVLNEKLFL